MQVIDIEHNNTWLNLDVVTNALLTKAEIWTLWTHVSMLKCSCHAGGQPLFDKVLGHEQF